MFSCYFELVSVCYDFDFGLFVFLIYRSFDFELFVFYVCSDFYFFLFLHFVLIFNFQQFCFIYICFGSFIVCLVLITLKMFCLFFDFVFLLIVYRFVLIFVLFWRSSRMSRWFMFYFQNFKCHFCFGFVSFHIFSSFVIILLSSSVIMFSLFVFVLTLLYSFILYLFVSFNLSFQFFYV